MNFTKHLNLEGHHAPFGASTSSWLRYDDEKLLARYQTIRSAEMGSKLHAWAKETIDLKIKQPRSSKTLAAYVNDAIGFRMQTEVVLYFSDYFFGTADAISFQENVLRIHDLKTGKSGAPEEHIDQLKIYAALFCLEYRVSPASIQSIELRVYKMDEVLCYTADPIDIQNIMDMIQRFTKLLERQDKEV